MLASGAGETVADVASDSLFAEVGPDGLEAGVVLVAAPEETDHFFRHSVVLLLDHTPQGSRGVVLEMATAFQIGEMSTLLENTPLADNTLFRGGGGGSDDVVVVHPYGGLPGARALGPHGLFTGGVQAANEAVGQGAAPACDFKFFFNHCEWLPGSLAKEVEQGVWKAGITDPGLCTRQVSSQSEHPMSNVS
ncbi:hypothetical protein T484DRAFT_1800478 [Baffinella frigidus]|nr:hypothetical protein T484DRAFT_1800478 [Cryptophyta sp. CCMP2293]